MKLKGNKYEKIKYDYNNTVSISRCGSKSVLKPNKEGLVAPSFFEIIESNNYSIKISSNDPFSGDLVISADVGENKGSTSLENDDEKTSFILNENMFYIVAYDQKTIYKTETEAQDDMNFINLDFSDYKFIEKGKELFNEVERDFETYEIHNENIKFYFDKNELLAFSTETDFGTSTAEILELDNKPNPKAFELPKDFEIIEQ